MVIFSNFMCVEGISNAYAHLSTTLGLFNAASNNEEDDDGNK